MGRLKKPKSGCFIPRPLAARFLIPIPALQEQNYRDAFAKRVIGLPGETIEVKGGKVYINGTILKETYINEQPEYEMPQIKVPPKSYYFFGDNRNNAYDSHYWGPVSEDYIIGRAAKIFWPVNRIGPIR
ncbi:MAG: signal peptidase I [Cyanobacteria bacterium]|nr:signal peptidase I [Cyanobacteriota bacterium]